MKYKPSSEKDNHAIPPALRSLKEAVANLLITVNELRVENARLKSENHELKRINKIQKNSLKALEKQIKTRRDVQILSQKDVTSTKHTLNKLIEEVDRCIQVVYTQDKSQ